ncbi:MAG: hypothetical protein ACRYF3_00550 [Janthinobacterium lividum]
MCGGCGSGRVRGPWEDVVAGRGPREVLRRSKVLGGLLHPLRLRVQPWGPAGYVVTTATGGRSTAAGLDDVTAQAARRDGWVDLLATRRCAGLSGAEAVVLLSALVATGTEVRALHGPVTTGAETVRVHGREVTVVSTSGSFSLELAANPPIPSTGRRPTS